MLTLPTVFAIGDKYNIFVPFSCEVIMWVKVGDKTYYDEYNGILRSNTNMHKVELPMSVLDSEKKYTVCYKKAIERKPYFPKFEDEVALTFDFRPVPTSGPINIYHIADAHNLVDEPVRAGRYFGDKLGLLILNGDIPNHSGRIENFNAICEIAAKVTGGSCPSVYVRGNHDTRGIHAEDMPNYIPTLNGKTYYSFRVGSLWGLAIDCGEDKPDGNAEYGGTICFHGFREREDEYIHEIVGNANKEYNADGVEHRIVISHIPFSYIQPAPFNIEQDIYREWTRVMRDEIKPELLLYGHLHQTAIYAPGSDFDSYSLQPCPAIVGSAPILPHSSPDGKTGFTGCAITLDGDKMTVVFNNDKGEIVSKHEI
jgi:predicted phosphodiesterase